MPVKKAMKANIFQMNRSMGQNLLKSKNVIQKIIDFAEIRPDDTVIEIGPGIGNLTQEILLKPCNVIAIEKDPRMIIELNKKFHRNPNFRLIHADILQVDLPNFDLCISNIPFNISSAIIFKLLSKPTFRRAILMVQDEFAKRIVSRPGNSNWGRLAINAQLYANVRQMMSVNKKNFIPAPKVDSAVISIQPREFQANIDFNEWDGLIKICFSRPNRTLGATFKKKKILNLINENRNIFFGLRNINPSVPIDVFISEVLNSLMIHDSRPIHLDIEDFLSLLKNFNEGGVHFS